MSTIPVSSAARPQAERLALLVCAGVVVYVLVDVLLGILRPGLSLIHHAESDYGVGPYSWLMDLNFLLRGALSLALAAALLRVGGGRRQLQVGAGLVIAWGIGSGILAFFPDDPPGYPSTAHGAVHLVVAALALICIAAATVILSLELRRRPQFVAIWSWLLALSVLGVLALLLLGHTHYSPHTLAGLYERVFLGLELLWILVVGWRLHQTAGADLRPT